MRNCNLVNTDFRGSDAFEGLFVRAMFHQTLFNGSNLRESIFISAFLNEVDFSDCDLTGADFSSAKINGLIMEGTVGFKLTYG
jgi:uncharacterized protein YjbI with pentapeptide repeats